MPRRFIPPPDVTEKEMAAAIGTLPETLSRMLLRLKKEQLLLWEKEEIIVENAFWRGDIDRA